LPTALLTLIVSCTFVQARPYNFLDNYRNPPPSPEDGPPASAHASRNKDLLPAQICGVVGGYVVTVLIWGVLLLTVGRRMRRKTENSPRTLELELVTKRPAASLTSPASVRSATSWTKKIFKKEKGSDSPGVSPSSPVVHSPSSFDQHVLDADRERAQAEMERLYAAVMDHDRKKSYSQVSTTSENEPHSRRPSAINTSHMTSHSNPSSPVKAIYPPGYPQNGPPTAPLPRDPSRLRDEQPPPASPRSILSKKSHTSIGSSSSKTRFNLKNLRISGPIQKYPHDRDEEARTPLSPRLYNPGAPPSPPTMQNSPTTPGDIEEAYEQLDEPQPLPRPAPHRTISMSSSQAGTPTTSQPAPPSRSAASSNTNLPLRGYAEPLKSPDLRTTVLDRRLDKLPLTTPKTGVPYTPYTPYMPFTPVTPVTPHLMTKKERKAMAKIGGRKVARREDDLVQSPKEIFGDAW
ncbi:hypothetical protein K458DRAFT_258241, partial [Lentithecium fluviatile CBS 122367]